jgi:pimeloyl-ACP methyl ester carboxylesterase
MTIVCLHGVPETASVWDGLRSHLPDHLDVIALPLPGFGSPLPDGFDAHMETYASWVAERLGRFDRVDLVTHDWGALLALRVLADRPPNVRSVVTDVGDLDPSFRWHDTALTWQTPGDGEALMDAMQAMPVEDRAELLAGVGVPCHAATAMAAAFDADMAGAILRLYRSAIDIGTDWGPGIDRITAAALVVESANDPFRAPRRAAQLARRLGAQVWKLADAGHFWMLEQPAAAAQRFTTFWDQLDGEG